MRNPTMIGQRVYLRAFEEADAEMMAVYSAAESETFFKEDRAPKSSLALAPALTELYGTSLPDNVQFAICLRADDRFIGRVGIGDIDWISRTGETGIWIGTPEYRGHRYGPEAKHLLLEYAFDRLQLQVVSSTVWEPNVRSAAAVKRQGYRVAGQVQRPATKNRRRTAMLNFDLTRDEWLAARDAYRARAAENVRT